MGQKNSFPDVEFCDSSDTANSIVAEVDVPKPLRPVWDASDTVILFDWDDTLCPTSWILSRHPRFPFAPPGPMTGEDWQQLAEVADLAEAVLVRASVQGTVAILTNA